MINNAEWHGASRVNAVRQTVTSPESRKERKYIMFDYNNKYLMEREILFRGKTKAITGCPYNNGKPDGEWVFGYVFSDLGAMKIRQYETDRPECNDYEVDPETVGQYTGLADKNGVKIFEGDIVKGTAYSATQIGVIVWIDEISSFGVHRVNAPNPTAWENSSILRCVSLNKKDEFAAEVIGNIYDNPELLGA